MGTDITGYSGANTGISLLAGRQNRHAKEQPGHQQGLAGCFYPRRTGHIVCAFTHYFCKVLNLQG
jgi:hypothetical protein